SARWLPAVRARGVPTVLPSTLRIVRPGALGRAFALSKATMERSARTVDCVEPKRPLLFDSTIHHSPFWTRAAYAGSRIQASTASAVVSIARASPPERALPLIFVADPRGCSHRDLFQSR